MNAREFVVLVYIISFLVGLIAIGKILIDFWFYLEIWHKALIGYSAFVAFCGVLIAYWVFEDGQELIRLGDEKYQLWKQVQELESKMKKTS
jgi:hypothetical protein